MLSGPYDARLEKAGKPILQHCCNFPHKTVVDGSVEGTEKKVQTSSAFWVSVCTSVLLKQVNWVPKAGTALIGRKILLYCTKELLCAEKLLWLFSTHGYMGMGIDSTIHTTPGAKCARAPEALEGETAIEVEEGLPASRTACLQDFLFNVPASFKYSALVLLHRK